ncbi:MAG: NUDIX domain-containing protein [Bacilli bacterium]|nr:NUDIX domain-containing protein [Bacilli bacterium]
MELLFITKNQKKINAAKKILENEILIKNQEIELQEIQGNPLEVAIQKAIDAYKSIEKPLIINDSSLIIPALNDFPGSYASYVEKILGDKGILKLLENENNRIAYYLDILVYIDKYGYQVFQSKTMGTISNTSYPGDFYPYDKIFIREGDTHPIAYYGYEKIDKIYENNTYHELLKFLKKRKTARGITFIDNKVLLLHRIRKENDTYLDYYAIPGGGVEDETLENACIRELLEETSLNVEINTYLGFEEYESGVCYYFLTNYLGGTPILGGEEKEKNNPDNFYEIKLIDINDIDSINMYGEGIKMIKMAYSKIK